MNNKIKVCHLTSVHPRYDVRIFSKECQSLVKEGFEVMLIVADGLGDEIKNDIKIFDIGLPKGRFKRILFTPKRIYKKVLVKKPNILRND